MGVCGSLHTLVGNWTNSGFVGWGAWLGSGQRGSRGHLPTLVGQWTNSGFVVQGETRKRPPLEYMNGQKPIAIILEWDHGAATQWMKSVLLFGASDFGGLPSGPRWGQASQNPPGVIGRPRSVGGGCQPVPPKFWVGGAQHPKTCVHKPLSQ